MDYFKYDQQVESGHFIILHKLANEFEANSLYQIFLNNINRPSKALFRKIDLFMKNRTVVTVMYLFNVLGCTGMSCRKCM